MPHEVFIRTIKEAMAPLGGGELVEIIPPAAAKSFFKWYTIDNKIINKQINDFLFDLIPELATLKVTKMDGIVRVLSHFVTELLRHNLFRQSSLIRDEDHSKVLIYMANSFVFILKTYLKRCTTSEEDAAKVQQCIAQISRAYIQYNASTENKSNGSRFTVGTKLQVTLDEVVKLFEIYRKNKPFSDEMLQTLVAANVAQMYTNSLMYLLLCLSKNDLLGNANSCKPLQLAVTDAVLQNNPELLFDSGIHLNKNNQKVLHLVQPITTSSNGLLKEHERVLESRGPRYLVDGNSKVNLFTEDHIREHYKDSGLLELINLLAQVKLEKSVACGGYLSRKEADFTKSGTLVQKTLLAIVDIEKIFNVTTELLKINYEYLGAVGIVGYFLDPSIPTAMENILNLIITALEKNNGMLESFWRAIGIFNGGNVPMLKDFMRQNIKFNADYVAKLRSFSSALNTNNNSVFLHALMIKALEDNSKIVSTVGRVLNYLYGDEMGPEKQKYVKLLRNSLQTKLVTNDLQKNHNNDLSQQIIADLVELQSKHYSEVLVSIQQACTPLTLVPTTEITILQQSFLKKEQYYTDLILNLKDKLLKNLQEQQQYAKNEQQIITILLKLINTQVAALQELKNNIITLQTNPNISADAQVTIQAALLKIDILTLNNDSMYAALQELSLICSDNTQYIVNLSQQFNEMTHDFAHIKKSLATKYHENQEHINKCQLNIDVYLAEVGKLLLKERAFAVQLHRHPGRADNTIAAMGQCVDLYNNLQNYVKTYAMNINIAESRNKFIQDSMQAIAGARLVLELPRNGPLNKQLFMNLLVLVAMVLCPPYLLIGLGFKALRKYNVIEYDFKFFSQAKTQSSYLLDEISRVSENVNLECAAH